MFVLTRKIGESIKIKEGESIKIKEDVKITVIDVKSKNIRLGIVTSSVKLEFIAKRFF